MPLGDVEAARFDQHLPLTLVRSQLAQHFTLHETDHRTGGPARYMRARKTGGLVGFITPLTHNFCESCNRVRVTCTGTLYMCLGHDDAADLRTPLRASDGDERLEAGIREAIARKPRTRLRHRSEPRAPGRRATHERHRRLADTLRETVRGAEVTLICSSLARTTAPRSHRRGSRSRVAPRSEFAGRRGSGHDRRRQGRR